MAVSAPNFTKLTKLNGVMWRAAVGILILMAQKILKVRVGIYVPRDCDWTDFYGTHACWTNFCKELLYQIF
jgi:uncharacterized membrane protein